MLFYEKKKVLGMTNRWPINISENTFKLIDCFTYFTDNFRDVTNTVY